MQLAAVFKIPINLDSDASILLTDYYSASLDFAYKYNLAIFESATQAVSSVLNLSSSYPQEAQDTIPTIIIMFDCSGGEKYRFCYRLTHRHGLNFWVY